MSTPVSRGEEARLESAARELERSAEYEEVAAESSVTFSGAAGHLAVASAFRFGAAALRIQPTEEAGGRPEAETSVAGKGATSLDPSPTVSQPTKETPVAWMVEFRNRLHGDVNWHRVVYTSESAAREMAQCPGENLIIPLYRRSIQPSQGANIEAIAKEIASALVAEDARTWTTRIVAILRSFSPRATEPPDTEKHTRKCGLYRFTYEVGSGETMPTCSCGMGDHFRVRPPSPKSNEEEGR